MDRNEALTVQFVGSGDAFGSGGRLQTCISVQGRNAHLLIDCGASSLIGMRKHNVDINSIDVIAITHFHGDHSSGLAFFLYHEIKVSRRKRPLTIAGPIGIKGHCHALIALLFPSAQTLHAGFELTFVELPHFTEFRFKEFSITALPAFHTPETNPSSIVVRFNGKKIIYTGDTGWTDHLTLELKGTDLLIAECYKLGGNIATHLTYEVLEKNLKDKFQGRVVLTHPSQEVIAKMNSFFAPLAYDGAIYEL